MKAIRNTLLIALAISPIRAHQAFAQPAWTNVTSPVLPSPEDHAMAFDSIRGRVVHFGGWSNGILGDTWEWDGALWRRQSTTGPSARYGHAMVYDAARHLIVLFGGIDGAGNYLNDTWEWDGTAWNQRTVQGPSARQGHAMAYDVARGHTVLFGGIGYDGTGHYFGDTWEWDGQSWTQISSDGPAARYHQAMAYDAALARTVLFGGYYFDGTDHYFADTWEWNGSSWSQLTTTAAPSLRSGHAVAYDSFRSRIILFGGYYNDGSDHFLGDTWEWDGVSWAQVGNGQTTPTPAYRPAMAFDSVRNVTLLLGGFSLPYRYNGTWEWNGSAWANRSTDPPYQGFAPALSFDSYRSRLVLFGGAGSGVSGDTWEWDGGYWLHRSSTGPAPRYGHAMAFDDARAVVVLFGGWYTDLTDHYFGDTWEWDGTSWTLRSTTGPSPRTYHAMTYDSGRHRVVLFGGYEAGNFWLGDTWEWDGNSWTQRSSSDVTPRFGSALAYDSDRRRTVLFGGMQAGPLEAGDTWEWDGNTWSLRAMTGPEPRYYHAIVYDSARRKTVLFGGGVYEGGPTYYLDDTWEWDGTNWAQRNITGPAPRNLFAMAYDSSIAKVMLYGGYGTSSFNDYEWYYGDPDCLGLISVQPGSPQICQNSAVSAHISAPGATSYQWQKLGVNLTDTSTMLGTQTDTLVFTQAQPSDSGPYHCVIKLTGCGTAISDAAMLTVYPTASADGNTDGHTDALDIPAFISALVNHDAVSSTVCAYDLTADGIVNLDDLAPFVSRLLGQN